MVPDIHTDPDAWKRWKFEQLRTNAPTAPRESLIASIEREYAVRTQPEAPSPMSMTQKVASGARSALQGLTLGNWDEIEAFVNNPLDRQGYRAHRDQARREMAQFGEENPITSTALELGGAVAPVVAATIYGGPGGGSAALSRTAPLMGRMAAGGAAGAGMGLVGGVGNAEEMKDIPRSAAIGTGTGLLFGAGFPAAGAAFRGLRNVGGNVLETGVRSTAETPGVVGSLAQRAMPWAERRAEDRAQQKLAQAFANDQINPTGAARALSAATNRGTPAAVADVGGENVLELAATAFNIPGQGRRTIGQLASNRVAGSSGRLAEGVERTSGARFGNMNRVVEEIAERRKAPAAQLYDEAFSHGAVQLDDGAQTILMSEDALRAWREGMRRSRLEGAAGGRPELEPLFKFSTNEAGQKVVEFVRDVTVRDIDYIKRGLDAAVGQATRQGDDDLVRVLTKAKNSVLRQVDDQVPKYAEARALWAGEEALINAADLGKRFLQGSDDNFADLIAGFSPGELEMYRRAAANSIAEQLRRREGRAIAVNILTDPTAQRRLRAIYPDDESFNLLQQIVQDETNVSNLFRRINNQSATAKNLANMLDFATDYRPGDIPTSPMGIGERLLSGVAGEVTGGATASSADALARLLSRQGPQGIELLEGLGDEAMRSMLRARAAGRGSAAASGVMGGMAARPTGSP